MVKLLFSPFILLVTLDLVARHYIHSIPNISSNPRSKTPFNEVSPKGFKLELEPLAEDKLPIATIYLLRPVALPGNEADSNWNDLLEFERIELY